MNIRNIINLRKWIKYENVQKNQIERQFKKKQVPSRVEIKGREDVGHTNLNSNRLILNPMFQNVALRIKNMVPRMNDMASRMEDMAPRMEDMAPRKEDMAPRMDDIQ